MATGHGHLGHALPDQIEELAVAEAPGEVCPKRLVGGGGTARAADRGQRLLDRLVDALPPEGVSRVRA